MTSLKIFIFLTLFTPVVSQAQLDTLVIKYSYNLDNIKIKKSLHSNKTHSIIINARIFPPCDQEDLRNKQVKKIHNTILKLLNKKLSEVKVLYIENPTSLTSHDLRVNDSTNIWYDTLNANIYKIDFTKFTNLKTIYLVGNDADDIIDMPAQFYNSSVNTVFCACLNYSSVLSSNILRKNKTIKVVNKDCETVWRQIDTMMVVWAYFKK